MKRTTLVLAAVAALSATGCSNKELIAQKDSQIVDLQNDVTRLQSEVAEQKRMTDDLDRQLADLQDQNRVLIVEKGNLTQITLDGSATFATASADLTDDGKSVIDRIWGVVQQYPDRRILVEGHTDDRPIAPSYRWKYASNWELSSARAHAVLHYLINSEGAAPDHLAAVGYGDSEPVADNGTPEGQSQNRRVVITVGSAMAVQERISQWQASTVTTPSQGRL